MLPSQHINQQQLVPTCRGGSTGSGEGDGSGVAPLGVKGGDVCSVLQPASLRSLRNAAMQAEAEAPALWVLGGVDCGVHDASRLHWCASLPGHGRLSI